MTTLAVAHSATLDAGLLDFAGDAELEAIARSTNLEQLTAIVRNGKRTFLEVGWALWRIRDARLYKLTHSSWEAWCDQHWWGTKRQADRTIKAAVTVAEGGLGKNVPASESVAIELARVPADHRPQLMLALGPEATAEQARVVVDRHLGVDRRVDGKASSPSIQDRRTPRWLFDFLNERFGPFHLDAFASKKNALCEKYYTAKDNALIKPWLDVTFANPEFDDMAGPVQKAADDGKHGSLDGTRTIMLGPVGCSQAWYHRWAIRGTVYVPDRRISFDLPDGTPTRGADRDTIVMAFGREHVNQEASKGIFRVRRLELPEAPAP